MSQLDNFEIATTGAFCPSVWESGKSKTKTITVFDKAETILKTYNKASTNEEKKAKLMESEDFIVTIEDTAKCLSQNMAGPITYIIKNEGKTRNYQLNTKELYELKVVANAYDLSKKEFRNDLSVQVKFTDNSLDGLKLLTHVIDQGRLFHSRLTALIDVSTDLKFGFGSPIAADGSFYLNSPMNKAQDSTGKWTSTGYLKGNIINGNKSTEKVHPKYPTSQLKEDGIHKLFGVGSIIQTAIRIEWSLSKKKFSLKVKTSGQDFTLYSRAIDYSNAKAATSKFGLRPEGFVMEEPKARETIESEEDKPEVEVEEEKSETTSESSDNSERPKAADVMASLKAKKAAVLPVLPVLPEPEPEPEVETKVVVRTKAPPKKVVVPKKKPAKKVLTPEPSDSEESN